MQMSHVISELLHCNFVALNRDYGGCSFVTVVKGFLVHLSKISSSPFSDVYDTVSS